MPVKSLRPFALLALSFSAACGSTTAAARADTPAAGVPPQARAAAEIGLYSWINDFIKDGVEPDEHFVLDVETLEQLKSARLGRGVAMKTVDPGQLMAGGSLRQATHATGEWRFVVLVDDSPVGLVDVQRVAGKYAMAGLGGKTLARHIEGALAPFPGRGASLVRSHQARADYLELSIDGAARASYAPLGAAQAGSIAMRSAEPRDDATAVAPHLIEEDALAATLRAALSRDTGTDEE